jgi:hypothetical protein
LHWFEVIKSRIANDKLAFVVFIWIFILEYATYLVRSNIADKSIKLAAFACLAILLFTRQRRLSVQDRTLLSLFAGMLILALLPSIGTLDFDGILQWAKIALMASILPILLVQREKGGVQLKALASIYMLFGALFSAQAIVASVAVFGDFLNPPELLDIGRRPGQVVNSLGLLGYANAVQNPIGCMRILRAQGWFVEPSILAAFLLFPVFASFGYYRATKTKLALIVAILTSIGLFLTYSLAGYLSIIVGIYFIALYRPLYSRTEGKGLRSALITVVAVFAVFLLSAKGLMVGANTLHRINLQTVGEVTPALGESGDSSQNQRYSEALRKSSGQCRRDSGIAIEKLVIISVTKMYGRDPGGLSGDLNREGYKLDDEVYEVEGKKFRGYKALLSDYPFGIGFAHTMGTHDETSANGLFFWLVSGGILGLTAVCFFFAYLFFTYCHPLLLSNEPLPRYLAASLVAHVIHNLSYGFWLAPFFLLHLYIVVAFAHWRCEREGVSEMSGPTLGRT